MESKRKPLHEYNNLSNESYEKTLPVTTNLTIYYCGTGDDKWKSNSKKMEYSANNKNRVRTTRARQEKPGVKAREREVNYVNTLEIVGPDLFDVGANRVSNMSILSTEWVKNILFEGYRSYNVKESLDLTKPTNGVKHEANVNLYGHSRGGVAATLSLPSINAITKNYATHSKINVTLFDPVAGQIAKQSYKKGTVEDATNSVVVYSLKHTLTQQLARFDVHRITDAKRVIFSWYGHGGGREKGFKLNGQLIGAADLNTLDEGVYRSTHTSRIGKGEDDIDEIVKITSENEPEEGQLQKKSTLGKLKIKGRDEKLQKIFKEYIEGEL